MKKLVSSLSVAVFLVLIGMAGLASAQGCNVTVTGHVKVKDFNYSCALANVDGSIDGLPLVTVATNGSGDYAFDKVSVPPSTGITSVHTEVYNWDLPMFSTVVVQFRGFQDMSLYNLPSFGNYAAPMSDIEVEVYNVTW